MLLTAKIIELREDKAHLKTESGEAIVIPSRFLPQGKTINDQIAIETKTLEEVKQSQDDLAKTIINEIINPIDAE